MTQVILDVEDQDRAKAFWTETLGFELARDVPYEDGRWLEVRSPDGNVVVALGKREGPPPVPPNPRLPTSNVFLYADDLLETYSELEARGVKFPVPPVEESFGWWSVFEDTEGNRFALVPRR